MTNFKRFKDFLSRNIFIFLIFSFCLVTFFWFKSDFIFNQDSGYFDVVKEFNLTLSTWNDFNTPGTPEDRRMLFNFGYILEYKILTLLFSYQMAQRIMFYIWMLSCWLGMYFLAGVLKFDKKMSFLAGGLYTFNIITLVHIFSYGSGTMSYTYFFAPFIIGLFIKGIKENKGFLYAMFTNLIWLFGFSVTYVNPVFVATIFAFSFFYFLFNLFTNSERKTFLFGRGRFFIYFVFTFFLLNLFWIPNFISGSRNAISVAFSNINENNAREKIMVETYPPTKLFNLLGFWALFGYFDGRELFYPFSQYYTNLPIIFLSYLLPVLVFASYLLQKKKEKRKDYLFFYLSTILAVGFIGFARFPPPVSEYFMKFMDFNSFISTGYRNVLTKAAPLLMMGYSILFAISIKSLLSRVKSGIFKKIIYICVFIAFVIILPFPLWKGEQFRVKVDRLSSSFVQIPDYYKLAKDLFSPEKADFKIAALPVIMESHIDLGWENGYNGNGPLAGLLGKPTLSKNSGPMYQPYMMIGPMITANKTNDGVPFFLSQYSSRYAVFFRDINWPVGADRTYTIPNKIVIMEKYLSSHPNIFQYVKEIGKLEIYRLNDDYYLPHFYTAQIPILSESAGDVLPKVVARQGYQLRSAIFLETNKLSKAALNLLKKLSVEIKSTPVLEFKKILSTKYKISVHGAKEIFPLIFTESFDRGWKAYIVKSKVKKSLPAGREKSQIEDLKDYKILDGNQKDQATKEEVAKFIENGWIMTLGDRKEKQIKHMTSLPGQNRRMPLFLWEETKLSSIEKYKIDFISKNYAGTIQNDNLPDGWFGETWLPQVKSQKSKVKNLLSLNQNILQLPEENHLIVNGYANSWIIDSHEICMNDNKDFCKKNSDGSFDIDFIVEFWPQRMFLVGIGFTLLVVLAFLGYMIYLMSIKNRKQSR